MPVTNDLPAPTDRVRFAIALTIVALGAAAFAIAFRSSQLFVYRRLFGAGNVLDALTKVPPWLRVVLPCLGGLVAGLVMRSRRPRGQNVSNVMEAVALGRVHLSMRTTIRRTVASWAAIVTGISIGREGPLIEFGGSLGNAVARALGLTPERLRVLVAAGTAAGFGAAYNTPFAAVLFVLETMIGIATLDALLPAIGATVVATTLTRAVAGGGPIYGQRVFTLASPTALASFAALGVLAAAAGWGFKRALAAGEAFIARYPMPHPWRPAIGGAIVGLIAVVVPQVVGNGSEALNLVLDQQLAMSLLLILLVAKIVATSSSVASGIPGGVFTPVLLVGGVLGSLFGYALHALGLCGAENVGGYALVGMAAMTAATTHAPLTAAVMIFELSGDYPIVLPLLLATGISTAVSRWLRSDSVYAAELRQRGIGWAMTLDGRRVDAETNR